MRTHQLTASFLLGTLLLVGCGGDDDLATPVAEDVRGARIDAAPDAAPRVQTPTEVAVAEQAPREIQPEVAPQDGPDPAAVPTEVPTTAGDAPAPDTGEPIDDAEPEQIPDLPLGDVPTADDEVTPAAVDEPEVYDPEKGLTEEEKRMLDLPEPDDDWKPEPPKPPVFADGEWHTSFDYLGSFDVGLYAVDEGSPLAQHTPKVDLPEKEDGAPEPEKGIPDAVRAMDGQKVRIEGYMIPLKFEDGAVKTFFLSRYMMGCCFGVLPKANEIIEVTMQDEKGAYYDAYMPFVVVGTFEIVEEGTSPEFLQSVFRIKADSADYAEDW